MSELPEGWAESRLGDLVTLKTGPFGSSLHKSDYVSGGTPVINPMHIVAGRLVSASNTTINGSVLKRLSEYRLSPGDVVLGRRGEMGRGAVVRGENSGWICGTGSVVLKGTGTLEPDFLQKFLSSPPTVRTLEGESVGSTMVNLNQGILKALVTGVPPLKEQKRIVQKIDALTEKSREAREALDEVPALLDKLRQSILAAAFRGDLTKKWREQNPDVEPASVLLEKTELPGGKSTGRSASEQVIAGRAALSVGDPGTPIPSGWTRVPMLRIARLESGHTPSRKHPEWWGGDVPWIGIGDARDHHGATIYSTEQQTNPDGLANSAARLLPKDTVCLSRTASVGYVTKMGTDMATSQDFVNWVCTSALLPDYLLYAFLAEGDHLLKFGKGSTHTTIYFPEVKAFHLALPPLAEQKEIVRAVQARLSVVEQLEAVVAEESITLEKLDPSILAKAFRGDLVPQDPNDEPASVLLERIRAEREQTGGGKKKRGKEKS